MGGSQSNANPESQVNSNPNPISPSSCTINSLTVKGVEYNIGDIVSYTNNYGYERFGKLVECFFDQEHQKYAVKIEGDGFNEPIFYTSIIKKENEQKRLSMEYNLDDRVILTVNGQDVVVGVTAIKMVKTLNGPVDKNKSTIDYKYADYENLANSTNWGSIRRKVSKDTPLSKFPTAGQKKYTLEDENKYRVKYMKYKAKYLAQKNI